MLNKKILFILALTFVIVGCAVQLEPIQNSQDNRAAMTATPPSEVSSLDVFIDQLRASGAAVEQVGPIEQPFFSVPGQKLLVNGQEVQVFAYGSEETRQAESGKISKDGSSIGTSMVTWIEPPHFWAEGNLITLYVGNNQEAVGLINQVMGPAITQP